MKYRHNKRGSEYKVIGKGFSQCGMPIIDMQEVVIYQGDDGKIWVRTVEEFFDGRFSEVEQ